MAAAQYKSAASKWTKASKALAKKYKTFGTLKRAKAYYKALSKLDGTFLADIKAIVVPADTAGDMHDLVRKTAADQALELIAAHSTSWPDLDRTYKSLTKSWERSTAAANLLRSDLGLPPVQF